MSHSPALILGASGMLGHKLFQRLRETMPGTIATMRSAPDEPPFDRVELLQGRDIISGVDVYDFAAVTNLLQKLQPKVIINCVGVIKQRDEAKSAIPTITINALLPHKLAEVAQGWGGRVIHFSTDCVFSGRDGSYVETSPSDAEDLYGKSKFLGEVAVANAITLRTSIIGRELNGHRSLVDWFLQQHGKTVKGYTKAMYSGITTNEMAKVVEKVIRELASLSGVYQVVSEPITKFDLLQLVRDAYGLAIEIVPDEAEVCDRSMRGKRFTEATGWSAPSWPEMIREMASDPTPYKKWTKIAAQGPAHV